MLWDSDYVCCVRAMLACRRGWSSDSGTVLLGPIHLPLEMAHRLLRDLWAPWGVLVWGKGREQPESLWQPIPPAVFCWNSLQLWCQPLGSSFPSAWRSCGFWTWQLGGQEPSIGTEVLHCGCGRVRIVRGCPGGPAWCQTGTRAILECYYRAVPADPPGEVEALCSGICTTFEFIWKKHV